MTGAPPPLQSRTWTWTFDRPVAAIWPAMADTARFNEAAGLPKHTIAEVAQPDGSVRYLATAHKGSIPLAWEDFPVNWVAGRWMRHRRVFSQGPLAELIATLRFAETDGGCTLDYTLEAAPANWLGRLALATKFFSSAEANFTALADQARSYARGERPTPFNVPVPTLPEGAADRAHTLAGQIEATERGHGLAGRLADLVLTGSEVDLWTIRPLSLARAWTVPERHAVEVCLEAVAQGLLRLRWDLVCPRCRVGKGSVPAMDQLPKGAHCPSCNIRYDRDYLRNVELAFHPATAIRQIAGGEYCLFGPMSTPHVKAQITLDPGETRDEPLDLPPGPYRLRTNEPGDAADVVFTGHGGFPTLEARGDTIRAGAAAAPGVLAIRNDSTRRLTFIVEDQAWRQDILTAHRATTLQAFRELFTKEVLRPGDDVEIDHVTIMFTDLKGSTALYERVGDPRAYALVREHFALLGRAVRDHDGAVVKTIGDAIMAVFHHPDDGYRCALAIQDAFAAHNAAAPDGEALTIKLGLHLGRCISVTLNDRLDYYGTAANMAARLQGQSVGGDIVLSREFVADPAVAPLLEGVALEDGAAPLKGYAESIPFHRLTAEVLAGMRLEH